MLAQAILLWLVLGGAEAQQVRTPQAPDTLLPAEHPSAEGMPPQPASSVSPDALQLRLVPIVQGNQVSSFGGEPDRFRQTPVYKAARINRLNLMRPDHPLVICSLKDRRLFYLFYNVVTDVPALEGESGEPYLIQRIKRTVTDYHPGQEPVSKIDFLVEAIKTKQGRLKRPDQHFGSFALGTRQRRRIVKQFEIGQGEIDGIETGKAWPFESRILFKRIQPYQAEPGAFDSCRFTMSRSWKLEIEFDRHGNYEMKCPDLGIEIVHRVPSVFTNVIPLSRVEPVPPPVRTVPVDPISKEVILQEGNGVFDLMIGTSVLADVKQVLGEPLREQRVLASSINYDFEKALIFNFQGRTINTIRTRPGFGGQTSRGIRHGDSREKVTEVYGKPKGRNDGTTQLHDGVLFWFDRSDRVRQIVIFKDR